MKLFFSSTSPFARKVHMLLRFTGLIDYCELVPSSFESDELRAQNPLGKIPALADGEFTLFDSGLICEYLDDKYAMGGQPSLLNRGIGAYYKQQKVLVCANGITEAAVSNMMELRRETEHSQYWIQRWHTAIKTSIEAIDIEHAGSAEQPHIATFAVAAALGYLDFRLDQYQWRNFNPELASWFEQIEATDWYIQTSPQNAP